MTKEKFSQVPIPILDQMEKYQILYDLQIFEGCFCISLLLYDNGMVSVEEDDLSIEVYLSKKDGGEFSWTRLLSNRNEKFFFHAWDSFGIFKGRR